MKKCIGFTLPTLFLFFSAISCTNPLRDNITDIVEYANQKRVDCELRDGCGIAADTVIEITYFTLMDTESLVLTGTMAEEAEVRWEEKEHSTFGVMTNIVYIQPKTVWSDNGEHTLSAACADREHGYIFEVDRTFGILDGAVYVSKEGDNINSGRIENPLDNIADACKLAREIYPDIPGIEIRVAEGEYAGYIEEYIPSSITRDDTNDPIYLQNGQHLLGGWNPEFSVRDPEQYPTFINGHNPETEKGYAVYMIPGTQETIVDGFTLLGHKLGSNSTITSVPPGDLSSSSLVIQNNAIIAYTGRAVYIKTEPGSTCEIINNKIFSWSDNADDIYLEGGEYLLSDNIINSYGYFKDSSKGEKSAISIYDFEGMIEKNEINMAQQTVADSSGISLIYSNAVIRNNVIDAGVGPQSIGISNISSSPVICNNTIYVGSGTREVDGTESEAIAIKNDNPWYTPELKSNPVIQNNLMLATGENYGSHTLLFVASSGCEAAEFSYNTYSNFASGLPADIVTNGESPVNLYHCLDVQTWKLLANAPAVIKSGGIDLSSDFQTDKDGTLRPPGSWSRGAYQW